ncbi:SDR family oxidoreductase [Pseudovibrio sp. JE062]|uniref:SDR family oxidoreductase n=1 Tax=Pseudovibrio sp. JE062 TaxID=439495 RepID=UPI000186B808|nr:SDR family oxidoreductase [Pseudovibrio sp. JE062]EEA95180.1 3-beta hydroxysteroid dehydrogenase/isomerase [Pseudovibrio sp. JE062]
MKSVVIAGATGYLGSYLVSYYRKQGWHVRALVRNEQSARAKGLEANEFFEGEATKPNSLHGLMDNADLVISALGITRQKDGLSYNDVDYQANKNLLDLAVENSVPQFAYIHVLNATKLLDVQLVRAKQHFVEVLQAAPIKSTVISPSGYFSDLEEFFGMAKSGRVYMFGSGDYRINPIHGADLAAACFEIIKDGQAYAEVGGPVKYTHNELAEIAFKSLHKKAKITHLPNWISVALQRLLETFTSAKTYGPIQFFLSAMRMDMIGKCYGKIRLEDHFAQLVQKEKQKTS